MTRLDGAALTVIDDYLDAILQQLPAGPAERRAIRDELYDGLIEATEARLDESTDLSDAVGAAIDEFGPPGEVAASYIPELTIRNAWRTGWQAATLFISAGFVWQAFYAINGAPNALMPDTSSTQSAFFFLIDALQVVPPATMLSALALVYLATRASHDADGTVNVRRASDALTVLAGTSLFVMSIMLVLALPNWNEAMLPMAVGLLLLILVAIAFVSSATNTRRMRACPARQGINE